MDFRIGGWLIGGRPNNLLILGDHLFLNYIFFFGQLPLINPGGIINPHLTLHYTTLHYTTLHDITLHCTTLITPHHDYNCSCACCCTVITLHCNHSSTTLHYTTATATTATTTALHGSTFSSSGKVTTATFATIRKKYNSNHVSVHQCIRSAIRDSQQPTLPIGFPFLKLPPLLCAALLVYNII